MIHHDGSCWSRDQYNTKPITIRRGLNYMLVYGKLPVSIFYVRRGSLGAAGDTLPRGKSWFFLFFLVSWDGFHVKEREKR